MQIIAILDFVSEDDSMVVAKTGCTDGNGKEAVTVLNSKQCAPITKEQINTLFKNWELLSKSPEYPLIQMLMRMR